MEDRHVLAVLVANRTGVLNRVTGLYSRRGFNIEALSVGTTGREGVSRITITLKGDKKEVDQITKQLEKLVDVIAVKELPKEATVGREVCFVKAAAKGEARERLIQLIDIFRASIIDAASDAITACIIGDTDKTEAFLKLAEPFGILEVVRSGLMAIERGSVSMEEEADCGNK
ncbi:MAG: acetolactate synthase small subunit [Bacillota bacterium]|nr:acetolactate synthase small subunit [Bacillota bacterium]